MSKCIRHVCTMAAVPGASRSSRRNRQRSVVRHPHRAERRADASAAERGAATSNGSIPRSIPHRRRRPRSSVHRPADLRRTRRGGRVSESDDCTAGGAGGGDGGGRRLAPLGAGRGGGSLAGKRDCPSTGPRSAAKPIAGSIPEDVRPVTGTYVRSSSVVAPGSDTLDDRLSAETRSTVGAVDR